MKHPIFAVLSGVCLFTFLSDTASAQEVDCANDQSQFAINHCTSLDLQASDNELNLVWSRVQGGFTGSDYDQRRKAALLEAQRAWLAYRDSDCADSVGLEWEGGTGRPMAVNMCLTELTKHRTKQLRDRYLRR